MRRNILVRLVAIGTLCLGVLAIPLYLQPLWGQAPGNGVDPRHNQKQQTKPGAAQPETDQRGTQNSPLVVDMVQRPKSAQEAAEEKKAAERKDYIDTWTLRLAFAVAGFTGLLVIFTLCLVIVGWRGVNAANRTLREIERQANLTEAQMSQWIVLNNWRCDVSRRTGPLSHEASELELLFDVNNPSSFPLTLNGTFRFNGNLPGAPTLTFPNTMIFPDKPATFRVHVALIPDQSIDYIGNGARISLHGSYFHVGPSKQRGPMMEIHANIVCRDNAPTVTEFETTSEQRQVGHNPIDIP